MDVRVLEPVGAVVTGLRLDDVSDDDVAELHALLAEHGVAVLPEQETDDEAFTAFLRRFGDLAFTAGEAPLPGHPDLNLITNVGRATPPRSNFHVDTSYVSRPPAYTALRAVRIPDEGGETVFTNQYRAHDTLPEELRAAVEGRTITHAVTGVDPGPDEETEADHPVFRPHPVTGRPALYLSTPQRCVAVSGLGEEESRRIVQQLFDHSTREDNTLRHRWRPGDVVMWDNGCVLHKADHSGVRGDRVMHRGMVAGYGR